jgi:hypothetical protein
MFSTFCIKMFLIIAIFHMFQTFFLRHEPDLSDRPIFFGHTSNARTDCGGSGGAGVGFLVVLALAEVTLFCALQ